MDFGQTTNASKLKHQNEADLNSRFVMFSWSALDDNHIVKAL